MWMNLDNITLNERNQYQRTTCCTVPFLPDIQNRHISKDRQAACGGRDGTVMGTGFLPGGMKMLLNWLWSWLDSSVHILKTTDRHF